MTLKTPLLMQAGGGDPAIEYSALDVRGLLSAIWRNEGVIRHGSTGAGALRVAQRAAGANFSVDVAAGYAAIAGDDVADQGLYLVQSTATENRVIPSPPVSGTRVHRVVARIKDKLHNGTWTTYEWTIEVLEDTGSGTPAVPASAISLARVSVAAGQASVLNSHITDDRANAILLTGRPAYVDGVSTRPPNPVEGESTWRIDNKDWEVFDGTVWRHAGVYSPQHGTGTITLTAAMLGSLVVFFDTPFAATPLMQVTLQTSSNFFYNYKISSLSTTSFEVTIRDRNDVNRTDTITVHWEAKITS